MPEALASHPKIRVVTRRFSSARLDAAIEAVATRLNALLAPGVSPGTDGRWPWEGEVDFHENRVVVTVDRKHESKRALIEAAVADELRAGTVRIEYGDVTEMTKA